MKSPAKIFWKPLLLLAFIKILFHLFLIREDYSFHRDEFLYLALGNHLDFGYWSNPPFIGFVAFLAENLFGDGLLAIRLPSILTGGGLVLLGGLIAREMGGGRYAQLLAAITIILSPANLRAFSMLMPVPFDIFFWTLAVYLLLKFINSDQPKFMLWLGVVVGLGMLNKYSLVFLVSGLAVAILLSPHRHIFIKKHTWMAVGLSLVIFLPNLIWQIKYNFPVINHMGELMGGQLVNVLPAHFMIDQLWMQFICLFVWIPGLFYLLLNSTMKPYRFIGHFYIATVILFLLMSGKSYYTLGMYPMLLAAGAVFWEERLSTTWIRIALPSFLVIGTLPGLPIGLAIFPLEKQVAFHQKLYENYGIDAGLRWEDGQIHHLPQDFADMLGWDEMAALVKEAYNKADRPERCMIYCSNYGQAGAVDFLNKNAGLPPVVSFADSYRLWIPTEIPDFDALVYVNDELGEDVEALFESVELIGTVENPYARERGTQVYLCQNPNGSFPEFWEERIKVITASYIW